MWSCRRPAFLFPPHAALTSAPASQRAIQFGASAGGVAFGLRARSHTTIRVTAIPSAVRKAEIRGFSSLRRRPAPPQRPRQTAAPSLPPPQPAATPNVERAAQPPSAPGPAASAVSAERILIAQRAAAEASRQIFEMERAAAFADADAADEDATAAAAAKPKRKSKPRAAVAAAAVATEKPAVHDTSHAAASVEPNAPAPAPAPVYVSPMAKRDPVSGAVVPSLWGLVSDVHFQEKGLPRIEASMNWMIETFRASGVKHVLCLGDLLNTRQVVNVHSLSSCMRFFDRLCRVAEFESVHVVLGNHDMHMKHSRDVSSLDGLTLHPLNTKIKLYRELQHIEIDGTPVLMMPYHEDQTPIVQFIQSVEPKLLARTVGMGHLSLNGAIQSGQSHQNVTRYTGQFGPAHFSGLLRTFTGHFHSHQTMMQKRIASAHTHAAGGGGGGAVNPEAGAVTYLGSPLQFNFGDLGDEKRGFVLYDPTINKFEHVSNPYAVQFVKADVSRVLSGAVRAAEVRDKFVMLEDASNATRAALPDTGKKVLVVSKQQFQSAKDKVIALGALDVRRQSLPTLKDLIDSEAMAAAMGGGDAAAATPTDEPTAADAKVATDSDAKAAGDAKDAAAAAAPVRYQRLSEYVPAYLNAADLSLLEADTSKHAALRERLQRVGLDIMNRVDSDLGEYESAVFDADIATLTIQNFLGVRGPIVLPLSHLPNGVWFIEGANGAGKSTILEAISWCQFAEFLRSGMKAEYAINDNASGGGSDSLPCLVRIDFANGYSIERSRTRKKSSSVRVFKNGVRLHDFEKGELKESQRAIEQLLGINFDSFARTVVLGSDTTQNFISSKPDQRRTIIEELLGLGRFEAYAQEVKTEAKAVAAHLQPVSTRVAQSLVRQQETARRIRDAELGLANSAAKLAAAQQNVARAEEAVKAAAARAPETQKFRAAAYESLQSKHAKLVTDSARAKHASAYHTAVRSHAAAVDQLKRRASTVEAEHERIELRIAAFAKQKESAALAPALTNQLAGVRTAQQSAAALLNELRVELPTAERVASGEPVLCPTCTQPLPHPQPILDKLHAQNELLAKQSAALASQSDAVRTMQKEADARKAAEKKAAENDAADRKRVVEVKSNLDKLKAEINAEESKLTARLQSAARDIGLVSGEMTAESAVDALTRAGKELTEANCQQIFAQLAGVSSELSAFARHSTEQQKEQELTHQHAMAVQALSAIETTRQVYTNQLNQFRTEVSTIESEKEAAERKQAELRQSEELYNFWDNAWGKKPNSMRTFLLNHCITELNSVLGTAIRALSDDGLRVHDLGAVLDGTLQVSAAVDSSTGNAGVEYAKRSGGQRRRTDLAIFFGLLELAQQRTRYRSQYIILDEIFDSLDQSGQDAVQRWISQLTKRMKKVFVISHSPTAAGRGLNTLHVAMGPRGTRIVDNAGVMKRDGMGGTAATIFQTQDEEEGDSDDASDASDATDGSDAEVSDDEPVVATTKKRAAGGVAARK